jgi:hypothetical protein
VTIIEAQQRRLLEAPGFEPIDINVDSPGLALRRLLGERIATENASARVAAE